MLARGQNFKYRRATNVSGGQPDVLRQSWRAAVKDLGFRLLEITRSRIEDLGGL